ncbi:MAG: DnaJ domain-containing protein [Gammaproteobacteria bacterium]|nr:DnaJ domain-containing protein [Gammaproteobacteria bacterium]
MVSQTHYEVLGVDENCSEDMVKFAYQSKLKDAKEKLQDSPLFFEKENNLKHAYQVLSSPSLRQAYNNKIAKERATASGHSYAADNSFNITEFLGELIFSKAFLASIMLIIVLLVVIPSGEERIAGNVIHKSLDYEHDINNQKINLENSREARYVSNQDYTETRGMREQDRLENSDERSFELEQRRLELQEQREEARIAREEHRLTMQLEKEARNAEYAAKRQEERDRKAEKYEKRQKELEAQRLSRERIRNIERAGELQRDVNRLKAGY